MPTRKKYTAPRKSRPPKKSRAAGDPTTEEKIKEAARKLFTQKGFAATRTRDIAEEAGINLALLNYYFRSKQKLFDLIMKDHSHSGRLYRFSHEIPRPPAVYPQRDPGQSHEDRRHDQ